ncbi:cupin domain-containing protein [Leucobacter japonicus]|uniref:cupin domain-containing protein n=1 Tax=Leucobacter japonicus TaxID=1461259 RepID=UPI0006A7C0B5|nr:cupin domain-containing protein [Leucobacter japonicus]
MSTIDATPLTEEAPEPAAGVGARLRRRRRALGLTLKDVSAGSGLTPGFLSQIERGQANASVRALQEICSVLKLGVGDLFEAQGDEPAHRVIRFSDAQGFSFGNGATKLKLTPSHFDHLEVLMGLFEPGGSTGSRHYTHGASEEVLVVIAGRVIVTVDGVAHELGELDSLHYNSSQPHHIVEATGTAHARVIWTMAPPTY